MRELILEDLQRRRCTPETIRSSRNHLDVVLERWGHLRLCAIDDPKLEEIAGEMDRSKAKGGLGWSPSTQRNRMYRFTGALRLAARLGWIEPRVIRVELPPVTLPDYPEIYEPAELAALERAARARDAGSLNGKSAPCT